MLKIFLLLTIAQVVDASTAKAAAQRTFMSNVQQQLEVLPAARQTAINALLESIKEDQAADGLTQEQKNDLSIAVSILVELYEYYAQATSGNQDYYDDQVAEVNACNVENALEFAAGADEISANQAAHSGCRAAEKSLWDSHLNHCTEFYTFLTTQASKMHNPNPVLPHCTPELAPATKEGVVVGTPNSLAINWKTQVENAKAHWDTVDGRFADLKEPCVIAFNAASSKNTECRGLQGTLQMNFCTRKTQRKDICQSRGDCYDREEEHRSGLETNYTALSATRVHIIQVLKKAVCFLKVIANGTDPALGEVFEIDEITPEQLNNTYCPTLDTDGPEFADYKMTFAAPEDKALCDHGPFEISNWTQFHTNYFSSIDLWTGHGGHKSAVWNSDPICDGLS